MSGDIYSMILNDGLMTFKFKNSRFKPDSFIQKAKGSIFVFQSKEYMSKARGRVVTSLESIQSMKSSVTHWTPNVYCYGTYTDDTRRFIKGHSETNLKQINTFYVDFDTEKVTDSDILLACFELGFMPTLIIKTNRGYQVYFVLEKAVYVTKHTNYKVVSVAKMISKAIREYFLSYGLDVDMNCNHFGIARFPTDDNIVFLQQENRYSFETWLNWSMKQELPSKTSISHLTLLTGTKSVRQIDEPWFDLLMKQSHIKGEKGLYGRNNVLFTLALACFSSGLTQVECQEYLQTFNASLDTPIDVKEYDKIINSAYSDEYTGANREYILMLCREWIDSSLKSTDLFIFQKWTKFKKKRSQRVRSHYSEWQTDVVEYLKRHNSVYVSMTKKTLRDAINIPERSLDVVLEQLKKQNIVLFSSKKGRFGGITIALVKRVAINVINLINEQKTAFLNHLANVLDVDYRRVTDVVQEVIDTQLYPIQQDLFELDVG